MDEEAELQRDYPSALHSVGQKTPKRERNFIFLQENEKIKRHVKMHSDFFLKNSEITPFFLGC